MLARLLNLHGFYLPLEMEYKDEFNESGYWESFEVQQLNDELLKLGDSSWFDLRKFSADRQPAERTEEFREKFREFVDRITVQSPGVIVIKDPRICRLVPLWTENLQQCNIQPSAVIPYRNPLEVAASIKNRDGFSTRYCLMLWLRNVLEAEVATRGMNRVFCSYTEMLNDWPGVFSRIQSNLHLSEMLPLSEVQDQVSSFISGSLKHWKSSDADLQTYVGSDGLAFRVFQLLKKAEYTDGPGINAEFDALLEELNQDSTIKEELEQRDQKVIAFQKQVSEAFDNKQRELDSISSKLNENQKSLEQKESQIASLVGSVSGLEVLLTQNATELARVSSELDSKTIALAQSNTSEISIRNELEKQTGELKEQKASLVDEIERNNQEVESLNLHLEAQAFELKRLQRELVDHVEIIEKIGKTLSWKITAPLRFIVDWLVLFPLHLAKKVSGGFVKPGKSTKSNEPETSNFNLITAEASEKTYVERAVDSTPSPLSSRLIAFYLPQFHPIPENDNWWGKGFTEWTNVTKAKPLYPLHHQPRVPDDLGYYDLRDIEVQEKQVALAKQYGLGGFCFYFYWFHGERLLETPVLQYLENQDFDLPFCLCWANENWTRTWDGKDGQVLIGQDHSEKDDLAFIEYLSKYLTDSRYIRVAGKPLLLVYRPNLLPDPAKTAERWRDWCRSNGIGEIYLAYTQSFEKVDPAEIGFDAAIEFPPNNMGPEIVTDQVEDLSFGFKGFVYDWTSIASRSEAYLPPDYTLFRGVTPSWDNTARRNNTGAVFAGNTPSGYQRWLENAICDTQSRFDDPSERLVFINAWNEWAEGAYLEPDAAYGYSYLQATKNALENTSLVQPKSENSDRKIILVAHDGHPHGAQYLMLYTARCLNKYFGFNVDMVVLTDGILIDQFKKWATVHCLDGFDHRGPEATKLAMALFEQGHTSAICNTTVSGLFLETLTKRGIRCISLVHELQNLITENKLVPNAKAISKFAEKVVFAAEQVMRPFCELAPLPEDRIVIRYQGNYKKNRFVGERETARRRLREKLGIPEQSQIVLGVGFADHRKGVDLFIESALSLCVENPNYFFVWIGHWEGEMQKLALGMLEKHPCRDQVILPGRQEFTDLFYAGADVYVLTSREDPFPTTVMEALEVGVPVIGFSGAGGSENLLSQGCGLLVPLEDVAELTGAIKKLLEDHSLASQLGQKGATLVREKFSFPHYIFDLLELAGKPQFKVSAIVPNYNYEGYLKERIESVLDQTYPIYELIVLDDASTDESVQVINDLLLDTEIQSTCVVNDQNSGSVFKQWEKGAALAKGDYLWICEADDVAEPDLVSGLVPFFRDEQVTLAYCQSRQIDEAGKLIEEDYLAYTNDVCHEHWRADFVSDGVEEIRQTMSVKNCIPNVSAVISRKNDFLNALRNSKEQLAELQIAGDWLVYTELMKCGKIAFKAKALNSHRRHTSSVTIDSANNLKHFKEILLMQGLIASKYSLNHEVKIKARAFAEHARTHLGIATLSHADEPLDRKAIREPELKARAIAFYLPQFHPIPENDHWWGKGFTEWINVAAAQPLFNGHYQPHLPADLGFYDLRLEEIRIAQAELARKHGIEGFCYWHYWFNGKRLLERPFNELLSSGRPNFPFCLAWVNESWSRSWLGEDKDVLIEQTYSREDDLNHIRWLIQAFSDPRYIRRNGQPVFLVYRPNDLPEPHRTTDLFRSECLRAGLPEPYLIGINGHAVNQDAKSLGFDATLHIMPQLGILPDAFVDGSSAERARVNAKLGVENDTMKVYDYAESLTQMLSIREKFGHETIPSIFVGWDNTPRRGENAIVLTGDRPEVFSSALGGLINELQSSPIEERLVFINAWNEWAEGNHLEPDQKWKGRFLQEASDALRNPTRHEVMKTFEQLSDKEWQKLLLRSLHDNGAEGFKFYETVKFYAKRMGSGVGKTPESRFLDFGCGWGRFMRIFRKDFHPENMYGVDVDPTVLDDCRECNVEGNFYAIEPCGRLPFPDNHFDTIVAYSVFTHLPEDIHMHWVRELARVARPGCVFALTLEPLRFLDFVEGLGASEPQTDWHRRLRGFSSSVSELKTEFHAGRFVYMPTGGGDFRSEDVYGDAVVPLDYVRHAWKGLFEIEDFIDDPDEFWQAFLVTRCSGHLT